MIELKFSEFMTQKYGNYVIAQEKAFRLYDQMFNSE